MYGNNNKEIVTVMTLIAIKVMISLSDEALSNPLSALDDNFNRRINKGIITGKANIAIIVLLLPVFELIPETIVKTVAKLTLPNSTAKKYNNGSPTGFLNITEYIM